MYDDDEHTPIHSSNSYPLWRNAASETIERVIKLKPRDWTKTVSRLSMYKSIFDSWSPQNKPEDKVRSKVIGDFVTLYQKVSDELSKVA